MAYYTNGYRYNVPVGYESREGVAALQQQMNAQGANLKVDGIWGPKTDAAYSALGYGAPAGYASAGYTGGGYNSGYGQAGGAYGSTDLDTLYREVLGVLEPPSISYQAPSYDSLWAQNETMLRPGYDQAIAQRRQQTLYNRAEIDVDAYSRGMGRSTYVTDVKDRAMDAEAADISRMEGEYLAAMAASTQEEYNFHMGNYLEAQRYNAQMQQQAQNAAFGYAKDLHSGNLQREYEAAQAMEEARQAALSGASGGKRGGSGTKKSATTVQDDLLYKELNGTAKDIYAKSNSRGEVQREIERLNRDKPYDSMYREGASEYIAGVLTGML